MAAYREIAAYSAYDMFSKYKYLIVNLVFPTSVFGVGISFCLRLFLIIAYLNLFNIMFYDYLDVFTVRNMKHSEAIVPRNPYELL